MHKVEIHIVLACDTLYRLPNQLFQLRNGQKQAAKTKELQFLTTVSPLVGEMQGRGSLSCIYVPQTFTNRENRTASG